MNERKRLLIMDIYIKDIDYLGICEEKTTINPEDYKKIRWKEYPDLDDINKISSPIIPHENDGFHIAKVIISYLEQKNIHT